MVPTLNREPHAVFACLSTTGVLEQNMNISCYGRKMLRDEQVFRSNHRESDKTAALAVRRISAKRTQASFGRARQRLGSVTRPSVEKFPVFFLLFTGRVILLLAAVASIRLLSKPPGEESGRFRRNERDSHANRIHADLAERTQPDLAEASALAGRA